MLNIEMPCPFRALNNSYNDLLFVSVTSSVFSSITLIWYSSSLGGDAKGC